MVDEGLRDLFLTDVEDEAIDEDDDLLMPPVIVPAAPQAPSAPATVPTVASGQPAAAAQPAVAQPAAAPRAPQPAVAPPAAEAPRPSPTPAQPTPHVAAGTREEQLVAALNRLMNDSQEIQAAALVTLDGFTMASALPEGMHEDRVGAMSAAILGLGERAAAELGRGSLSQVIIEGEDGYVVLISAGQRAALTCLADHDAKLGLVLYDMRTAAEAIAGILG